MIQNYGILASISWNSNHWAGDPTEDDLAMSKYGFVREHAHMHESLNFGHLLLPSEADGYYISYSPKLKDGRVGDNSDSVRVIFFISTNYHKNSARSIVGLYAFPNFREWFDRKVEHPLYKKYDGGNVRALLENILYLKNPLIIDNERIQHLNLLPDGKKLAQQGFNYLDSDNVMNILQSMQHVNPGNKKLRAIAKKLMAFG